MSFSREEFEEFEQYRKRRQVDIGESIELATANIPAAEFVEVNPNDPKVIERLEALQKIVDGLTPKPVMSEEQADDLYRERAALVAYLAACHPSRIVYNSDDSGWPIVFVDSPTGQMSWHINPNDMDLFEHITTTVYLNEGEVVWDGHSTAEKYMRLNHLTKTTAFNRNRIIGKTPLRKYDDGSN